MSRSHRLIKWVLLLLFVLASGWWMIHVPYRENELYRAIPAGAAMVGTHQELPERWPQFIRNPLGATLATTMGVDPQALEGYADDPIVKRVLQLVGDREMTWAYVPPASYGQEEMWAFSCWLGGKSQVLRWTYQLFAPKDWVRHDLQTGGSYWIIEDDALPEDTVLGVAFVEGLLVGALSPNPQSMKRLIATFQGRAPSLLDYPGVEEMNACPDGNALDRGFFVPAAWWPEKRDIVGKVGFAVDELMENSLSGTLCFPHFVDDQQGEVMGPAVSWRDGLGGEPVASIRMDAAMVHGLLKSWLIPAWSTALSSLLLERGDGPLSLALASDSFSGSLLGIKVPSLLAVMHINEPPVVDGDVQQALDVLNGAYRWGLVPRKVEKNGRTFTAFERTAKGGLNMGVEAMPAYIVDGPWLIMGSQLSAVETLVSSDSWAVARNRPLNRTTPASCWLDLSRSATLFRAAIKIYSFKLMMTEPKTSQPTRQSLNTTVAWLNALEPLRSCRLELEKLGDRMELQVDLGGEQ